MNLLHVKKYKFLQYKSIAGYRILPQHLIIKTLYTYKKTKGYTSSYEYSVTAFSEFLKLQGKK